MSKLSSSSSGWLLCFRPPLNLRGRDPSHSAAEWNEFYRYGVLVIFFCKLNSNMDKYNKKPVNKISNDRLLFLIDSAAVNRY